MISTRLILYVTILCVMCMYVLYLVMFEYFSYIFIVELQSEIQKIKNENETFQSMYTHYLLLINDLFL